MYILLSIICFVVTNFPELIVPAGVLAVYSTGRLSEKVGDDAAMVIAKTLIPICAVASVVLSLIMAVFVWNHYEETVSRGFRRWISNLRFFQNRLGFTIATLVEFLLMNFFLIYSIIVLVMSHSKK